MSLFSKNFLPKQVQEENRGEPWFIRKTLVEIAVVFFSGKHSTLGQVPKKQNLLRQLVHAFTGLSLVTKRTVKLLNGMPTRVQGKLSIELHLFLIQQLTLQRRDTITLHAGCMTLIRKTEQELSSS